MSTPTDPGGRPSPAVLLERALLPLAVAGLAVGLVALAGGWSPLDDVALGVATAVGLAAAIHGTVATLRRGETGVDIVALLAMAGALALGELLAGAVLAVMLTGGEALERYASRRARRELTALLERSPQVAHRIRHGEVEQVPVEAVEVGDRLVVRRGEVVPTDGLLVDAHAVLDESALTGESRPVEVAEGAPLRSGGLNVGPAFELRATATAADSTYAGIVRLVSEAAESRSPFVRLADRYAGWFVVLTLLIAGGAWLVSGSAVRALAVLVVATPCPLLLAAPAAIVGGLSSAARRGIIVKGGGALEALAGGTVVLLDKTGTLTAGRPQVTRSQAAGMDTGRLLGLAGSLEQLSTHPFAPAIVAVAREAGAELSFPADVDEVLGSGIRGRVDGHEVAVGQLSFVAPDQPVPTELRALRRRSVLEGSSAVHVAIDGALAGVLVLQDPLRPEAPRALERLRRAGIEHVIMVTGDRPDVAELIADTVGVDRILAERAPDEKVDAVREAQELGRTIMVGDGLNDAPALAIADVGIAMGARGATAASEAPDLVLTADRLEGVATALGIAQRTRRIALQSVLAGMAMSGVAMGFAAAGLLAPVAGAVIQELIDLAVIVNALRALSTGRSEQRAAPDVTVPRELIEEHVHHSRELDELDALASRLDRLEPDAARAELETIGTYLRDELLPHELEEEETVYPAVAAAFPGEDPTAPLTRTHREIARLVRLFERLVDDLPPHGVEDVDLLDAQRILWGLHGILRLHFALEDELYAAVTDLGSVRAPEVAGARPGADAEVTSS